MKQQNRLLILGATLGAVWACSSGSGTAAAPGGGAASVAAAPAAQRSRVFLLDTLPTCQYRELGDLHFTSTLRGPSLVRALGDSGMNHTADAIIKVQGPTTTSMRSGGGGGGGSRKSGGGGGGGGGSTSGGPTDITATMIRFTNPDCKK